MAAGSFLFGVGYADAATGLICSAGSSGGGTWTALDAQDDAGSRSTCSQYVLSSTGSPTTLTCTATLAKLADCEIIVYTFTSGPVALDNHAVHDDTPAAANPAGLSPGTLTGTNDVIIQYGAFSGTANACPNSASNPNDFPNGNAVCGLVNTTSTTAGTYGLVSGTSTAAVGAAAFKEAVSATVSPMNKRRRLEIIDE